METGSWLEVARFADAHGISLESDIFDTFAGTAGNAEVVPELVLDNFGEAKHPVSGFGANHLMSWINYRVGGEIAACRFISEIPPGERIELSYSPKEAPGGDLTIHRGLGSLVFARRGEADTFEKHLIADNNGAQAPYVTVEPDIFYTVQAAEASPEPLVISVFVQMPPAEIPKRYLGRLFLPGDHIVENSAGRKVHVPLSFWERFKADAI